MLSPARLAIRKHRYCAQGAFDGACWLRSRTLMPFQILLQEHRFALNALGVLRGMLALIQKMLLQILYLNDLLTLPAGVEHGTFFPVVDV